MSASVNVNQKWPIQFPDRIQLFSLPTSNGQKVSIALEELGLPYEPHRVDIRNGDQFLPEYRRISPNSKIPAIIDPNGPDGKPLTLMESGAILLYLAEKTGRLMPTRAHDRYEALQWLFFQVGHTGPMFGQFGHFFHYAKGLCDHPYPLDRYKKETRRLLQVLETRLAAVPYIAGADYTIVDIAHFPWVDFLDVGYKGREELGFSDFPRVLDWVARCKSRPAYERGAQVCALKNEMLATEMERVREVYAAINGNEFSAVLDLFDPDIERIEPQGFPSAGIYRGHAELKAHFLQARATWAEGSCEPERLLAAGDKVVALLYVRVRMKSSKDWIEGRLADVFTFRGGKITEMRTFAHRKEALEWAGVKAFELD